MKKLFNYFMFWLIPKKNKEYYRELNELLLMSNNEIDLIYDKLYEYFKEQVSFEEDCKHSSGCYPTFTLESEYKDMKAKYEKTEERLEERISELAHKIGNQSYRINYLENILDSNNIKY